MATAIKERNETKKHADVICFRGGDERRKVLKRLARQANFPNFSQFLNALIDQVALVESDFDVRDLELKETKEVSK